MLEQGCACNPGTSLGLRLSTKRCSALVPSLRVATLRRSTTCRGWSACCAGAAPTCPRSRSSRRRAACPRACASRCRRSAMTAAARSSWVWPRKRTSAPLPASTPHGFGTTWPPCPATRWSPRSAPRSTSSTTTVRSWSWPPCRNSTPPARRASSRPRAWRPARGHGHRQAVVQASQHSQAHQRGRVVRHLRRGARD